MKHRAFSKISLLLLTSFVLVLTFSSASVLNPLQTGSNSQSYQTNFYTLVSDFFTGPAGSANVTTYFTATGSNRKIAWVPHYDTSSYCANTNLNTGGVPGSANQTNNNMVTDEFSEAMILASMGANQTTFDLFYNTTIQIKRPGSTLPIWKVYRNGNNVTFVGNNDSATDATHRIGLALYLASSNSNFTDTTRRAEYRSYADTMAQDSLANEFKYSCQSSIPYGDGQICYWLAGGKDAAGSFASGPFTYTGYMQDGAAFMLAAYKSTTNTTYLNASQDILQQHLLSTNYTGGTAAANFKIAPKCFSWNTGTTPYSIYYTSGDCAYTGTTPFTWDEADAPRIWGFCDSLRQANLTGFNVATGIYKNVSDYCSAWAKAPKSTGIDVCLQYKSDGTCSSGFAGMYTDGLGAGLSGYQNVTDYKVKVDRGLTEYSWSNKLFSANGETCYSIYRQVRTVKSLGFGIGLDEYIYSGAYPDLPPPPISTTQNGITIQLVTPTNASSTTVKNQTLSVSVSNLNVTQVGTPYNDTVPKTYFNFTFNTGNEDFTGNYNNVSTGDGWLNLTGNVFTPNENLSQYSAYQLEIRGKVGSSIGGANLKFYPLTPIASMGSGDRFYLENNTGSEFFCLKREPDYQQVTCSIPRNSNYTAYINVLQNATRAMNINFTWNNGTSSGSVLSSYYAFSSNMNSTIGNNGSGIDKQWNNPIDNDVLLYNWKVTNIGTPILIANSTLGNSNSTVRFYNSSNFLLGTVYNVTSGSTASISFNYSTTGVKRWYANVTAASGSNATSVGDMYGFTITGEAETTPPASVSNLQVISFNTTWITWNWTDPSDSDFNSTTIYIDGIAIGTTTSHMYNYTGLTANTSYNITLYTTDNLGNQNSTGVFDEQTTGSAATVVVTPQSGEDNFCTTFLGSSIGNFGGYIYPVFGILAIGIVIGVLFFVFSAVQGGTIDNNAITELTTTFDAPKFFLLILGITMFIFLIFTVFGALCT